MNFNKKNRGEYRYYIENEEDISKNGLRSWLYNTFCVSNALANSQSIKDRIILEYVPSGQEYLQTIIEAMKENYSVWTTSYLCSWCSSCSRLWAERSKAFFTETDEMISEETDKELPYLPIILFHKVRTSCVLFRAQIAMALWTEIICLCRKTLIGKPYCKRKLQYDDCRYPYIKLLVHGLVMKSLHPKPCTYTATPKRH